MTIQKLDDFAENGDKNLTGIDLAQGFVQSEKPARQWFNALFNSIVKKVNEIADTIDTLAVSTDKIADGAVTSPKLAPNLELSGLTSVQTLSVTDMYAGVSTLDAPNINLAADGTLKRSNDPLNASTRKVGTALGNLVERDANGYPVNNNALGVGQTWVDVKASRLLGTTYTNSTGRPIYISVLASSTTNSEASWLTVTINSTSNIVFGSASIVGYRGQPAGTCLIPASATYVVNVKNDTAVVRNGILDSWSELR